MEVGGAVAVGSRAQERTSGSLGLLALQQPLLVGVVGGGIDHLQHAPSEPLELAGREPGGLLDQVLLGLPPHPRVEVVRELLDRAVDDGGLRGAHCPVTQRCPDRRQRAQRPGQAQQTPPLGGVATGGVGQPGTGIARAVGLGHVVRGREYLEQHPVQPAGENTDLPQGRALVGGGHEDRVHGHGLVQRLLDRGQCREDRVKRSCGLHRGLPGSTTARGVGPPGLTEYVDASAPVVTSSGCTVRRTTASLRGMPACCLY